MNKNILKTSFLALSIAMTASPVLGSMSSEELSEAAGDQYPPAIVAPRQDSTEEEANAAPLTSSLYETGEMQHLKAKAEAGDRKSIYKLAFCLHETKQYQEAAKFCEKGIGLGSRTCKRLLARMIVQHEVKGDIKYAMRLLEEVADSLKAPLYETDEMQHLKAKAEAGDRKSINKIAVNLYKAGNFLEAAKFCEKGIRKGSRACKKFLGHMIIFDRVEGDKKRAIALIKDAAESGSANAQTVYAHCLMEGREVDKDPLKAIDWYTKAAEQGYMQALERLTNIASSPNEGHSETRNNLAYIYRSGKGVAQDFDEALKLYTISSDAGDPSAKCSLACMYSRGEGVAKDPGLAFSLFTEASDLGHKRAKLLLSQMYCEGVHIKRDLGKAFHLATEAGQERLARQLKDDIDKEAAEQARKNPEAIKKIKEGFLPDHLKNNSINGKKKKKGQGNKKKKKGKK